LRDSTQTADVDGDGTISVEDFRSMLDPVLTANGRKTSVTPSGSANNIAGGVGASTKVTFS